MPGKLHYQGAGAIIVPSKQNLGKNGTKEAQTLDLENRLKKHASKRTSASQRGRNLACKMVSARGASLCNPTSVSLACKHLTSLPSSLIFFCKDTPENQRKRNATWTCSCATQILMQIHTNDSFGSEKHLPPTHTHTTTSF